LCRISILTGLIPPSSGKALIDGLDIRYQLAQIHQIIGVCPQFDIQWDNLTPREHVLFYSRLKGIPAKEEQSHALELLTHVGLQDDADRKFASQLSGGMRRRLSVAMALAGNPKIVFMDEPTSGLDPLSKRQLWDIVSASKQGRCMILTTHSMEEADVLCNRIGIIARGR
jgi:ABC-type multidrug transport system ATPase subunit